MEDYKFCPADMQHLKGLVYEALLEEEEKESFPNSCVFYTNLLKKLERLEKSINS